MALNRLHTFITLKKKKNIWDFNFFFIFLATFWLWFGESRKAVTFSCCAAAHLEPGSDFCCASRTKSPLLPGFPCLDWGAALEFWWMMFAPCCGARKSSETDFSSLFWFFFGLGLLLVRPSTAESHEGDSEHSRGSSFPKDWFSVLFYPYLGYRKCVFLYLQSRDRGMGWNGRQVIISPADYSFSCFDAQREKKEFWALISLLSHPGQSRRIRNFQGKGEAVPGQSRELKRRKQTMSKVFYCSSDISANITAQLQNKPGN